MEQNITESPNCVGRYAAALAIACMFGIHGCSGVTEQGHETVFNDLAEASGLDFWHQSGATGHYYMPEIMGAGIALLDYDDDDDLDVFVLQGYRLHPDAHGTLPDGAKPGHRLFRNEID
ncbi:MAG: hypothetical protein KJO85_11020, partial [Gammaproteobacteria bacterium]|nr:hypothetical protein [Gammaproteobacteria bacterium]